MALVISYQRLVCVGKKHGTGKNGEIYDYPSLHHVRVVLVDVQGVLSLSYVTYVTVCREIG